IHLEPAVVRSLIHLEPLLRVQCARPLEPRRLEEPGQRRLDAVPGPLPLAVRKRLGVLVLHQPHELEPAALLPVGASARVLVVLPHDEASRGDGLRPVRPAPGPDLEERVLDDRVHHAPGPVEAIGQLLQHPELSELGVRPVLPAAPAAVVMEVVRPPAVLELLVAALRPAEIVAEDVLAHPGVKRTVARAPVSRGRKTRGRKSAARVPAAAELRAALLRWYDVQARDLPWRRTRDAYAIWVSEVMLQQTQVWVVLPYWTAFLARFPDVAALARASLDDVLAAWRGLGYYARARNLHRAARAVVDRHAGRLPDDVQALRALPGFGRYT